jgi:uncharacterized metal-binding protein YceD (DUF177 family)
VGKGVFDIDLFKLADGKHSFEFDFDSTFFSLFENSVIEKGNGSIKIDLERNPSLITLRFHLKGEIELVCDRSLDRFMFPFEEENTLRVKYGDHWEELSEDLLMIPANTQKIDVGQFAYEFITLIIPMKKLHPRFQDGVDEDFIFTTSEENEESSNNSIDPRWNELKKIKK